MNSLSYLAADLDDYGAADEVVEITNPAPDTADWMCRPTLGAPPIVHIPIVAFGGRIYDRP